MSLTEERPEVVAETPVRSTAPWGWLVVIASAIGMISGSITIVDKIALLNDPLGGSFCDISSTVGCSPVLLAWQSSVLGPPNALLGVLMFAVLATSGLVVATGGRLVSGMTTGLLGLAVFFAAFLTWYMYEVAYSIGSLCPFCTVCAAGCLATLVGVNRMAAANGLPLARRLAHGNLDVLIALGWGAVIAAMLFSGIFL
jgi:uncharacterized membrane protein